MECRDAQGRVNAGLHEAERVLVSATRPQAGNAVVLNCRAKAMVEERGRLKEDGESEGKYIVLLAGYFLSSLLSTVLNFDPSCTKQYSNY